MPSCVSIRSLPGPRGVVMGGGLGSGFVISPEGYIVTNHHVVQSTAGPRNSRNMLVTFQDGRTYEAETVGSDPWCDVAVIKVVGPAAPDGSRSTKASGSQTKAWSAGANEFQPIKLGSSKSLRLGDTLVALGHPLGLKFAASKGILSSDASQHGEEVRIQRPVSPFARHNDTLAYATSLNVALLQTDAKLAPGNSGGPLINDDGEVVGICHLIIQRARAFGLNMAVPIDAALPVIRQIVKTGSVTRNYLGFYVLSLTSDVVAERRRADPSFGGTLERGLLVTAVTKGSPADKAGIKKGDILLSMDGVETNTFGQMFSTLGVYEDGRKVSAVVQSGSRKRKVSLSPTPLRQDGGGKKKHTTQGAKR